MSENIDLLLKSIQEETGLHLCLDEKSGDDTEDVQRRLEDLLQRLRSGRSKEDIFIHFLTGAISPEDALLSLPSLKEKFGFADMYLIYFPSGNVHDNMISSTISLFTSPSSTDILRLSDKKMLLIYHRHTPLSAEDNLSFISGLVDTINTEAMTEAYISYDRPVTDYQALPTTYANLTTALSLGLIFKSRDHIFLFRKMGLIRLVSSIPEQSAHEYLEDELPGVDFRSFDNETLVTIQTFFDSGLNIAETARALYLHRNTLVYRLDRFRKMTGLDIRNFDDAIKIRVGMLLYESLKSYK